MTAPGREALLEHVGFLRNLARGLVDCDADADDVVQETLLVAMEKPPAPGNLRGWLGKVARNIALMRRRSRRRAEQRNLLAARGAAPPSPAEIAARLEIERRIVDALTDLDEPYRSTLILHFYDGLKPIEIARHLGIPDATVRVRLKRGLERLRARLDEKSKDRRALMLGLLLLAERPSRLPVWAAAAAALLVTVGGAAYVFSGEPQPAPRPPPIAAVPEPEPPSPKPPPLLVTGRVVDAYGRPRAGFTVARCEAPPRGRFHESHPRPLAEALTDATGEYALELPEGRFLVRAGEEEAIVEEPTTLDFRIAGEPARGRVTEGGLPVQGAAVSNRFGRTTTDRDGGFALDPPLEVRVPGLATRVFPGPPYEIVRGAPFPLSVPAQLEAPGAIGQAGGEFPFDEATAIVNVPGSAPQRLRVRRGGTVALDSGRTIEGVVTCEGAPVADAEVTWLGIEGVRPVARTDRDGRYSLSNVPSSAVALTATHREFLPKGLDLASFILGGSGGTMDSTIEMVRAVEREGRVLPAALGIRVHARPKGLAWSPDTRRALERAGLDWTAVTAADGSFTIRQLPPDVPLVVTAEGLDGVAEETDSWELTLHPWPVTDGEVVDEHGTPVRGASIRGAGLRGWSEPDGRFRLYGTVEGDLLVTHPEFASVIARNAARIVLPRGEVVRGIVDAPGALVLAGPRSTYADGKGAFELRGLEPGTYRVSFHAKGRVARAVEATAPGAPLDLSLERAGRLEGRVTTRGAPVAGARVHAIFGGWAVDGTVTDADGRFVLDRVPERAPFALRIVAGTELRIDGVTSGSKEIELP